MRGSQTHNGHFAKCLRRVGSYANETAQSRGRVSQIPKQNRKPKPDKRDPHNRSSDPKKGLPHRLVLYQHVEGGGANSTATTRLICEEPSSLGLIFQNARQYFRRSIEAGALHASHGEAQIESSQDCGFLPLAQGSHHSDAAPLSLAPPFSIVNN
jgi:hypothetical protein